MTLSRKKIITMSSIKWCRHILYTSIMNYGFFVEQVIYILIFLRYTVKSPHKRKRGKVTNINFLLLNKIFEKWLRYKPFLFKWEPAEIVVYEFWANQGLLFEYQSKWYKNVFISATWFWYFSMILGGSQTLNEIPKVM